MRGAGATGRSRKFGSFAAALLLALGAATSTLFTQVQQCTFEFNPPSASFDATGGAMSVACTAGCAWTAVSNVTWISIDSGSSSNQSGSGTVQYTVQANTSGALRTGTITFSNSSYQNATYTITQSGSSPSSPFSVAPAALIFNYQQGQAVPAAQTLNVSSLVGDSRFLVSAATNSGGSWLAVSPSSGVARAPGDIVPISVSVNPSGLAPGIYSGTVVISAPQDYTTLVFARTVPAVSVPVTLTVTSAASQTAPYAVAPAALIFNYQPGQTIPAAQTLYVSSGVGGSQFVANAVTSSGGAWLAVSPSSGATGASGAAVPISVSVYPTGLSPGLYTGNITISQVALAATGASVTTATAAPGVSTPVTLTVTGAAPQAAYAVAPAALIFYYQRGQALPAAQTLNVANGTSGSPFLTSAVANSGGVWLAASPSSGNAGSSGGPVPISVSVNPGGLTPGLYMGNIIVSPLAAPPSISALHTATTNNATTITGVSTPVTLTVSDAPPPPLIAPKVLRFQFDPAQPASLPQTQPVTIASGSGAVTQFTVTASVLTPVGAGWISVDKTGGTTPATVDVTVNPVGLHPGRYVALMQISTVNPAPVTLGISPGEAKGATVAGATCNANQLATAIVLDVGTIPIVGTSQIFFDDSTPNPQAADIYGLGQMFSSLTPTVVTLNTSDCGWLSISPPFSSTPASFTVTASTTNYPAQQLSGLLVFSDALGATATAMPVEATSGDTVWRSDLYSVALYWSISNGGQASQTTTIANPSASSAAIIVSPNSGWLSVPNPTMAIPGTLTITAQPAGLGVGTTYGSITISGSGVNSWPLQIPVSLTVMP